MSLDDMNATAQNRHRDAVLIQAGACNLSGVARQLVRAINQCHRENLGTQGVRDDPAIRMIVHQMAFLCKTHELDFATTTYTDLLTICEQQSTQPEARHGTPQQENAH